MPSSVRTALAFAAPATNPAPIPTREAAAAAPARIPLSLRAMGTGGGQPAPYLDGLNPAQRQAVEALERAVAGAPGDPTINEHLGDAYWAVGRRTEARYQWRRALDLAPASEDRPRLSAKLRDGLQTSPAASAMR